MQRASDVSQGLGDDQDVTIGDGRSPHPEGRPVGLGRPGVEVGHTGAVCCRLEAGDLGRNCGGERRAVDIGRAVEASDERARSGTQLHGLALEGVGGAAFGAEAMSAFSRPLGRQRLARAAEARDSDSPVGGPFVGTLDRTQLLVDPLIEERLQGRVGDDIGDGQGGQGDHPDGDEEAGPQ